MGENGGAFSPPRVALVIGNEAYAQAPVVGAVSNAQAVAAVLRKGGFDVVFSENAQRAEIEAKINAFSEKLSRGVVAIVFFSGHAIQSQGRNFLVPVDAKIESAADVSSEAMDVDLIFDRLIPANPTGSAIILDASRDNPWQKAIRSRDIGLAAHFGLQQIVFAYADAPGRVVPPQMSSLFSTALVKSMETPNLGIMGVLHQTRDNVTRESHGQQVPWDSSDPRSDFVVTPTNKNAGTEKEASLSDVDPSEQAFWNRITDSDRQTDFQSYLDTYPHGKFVSLALSRLKQIEPAGGGQTPDISHGLGRAVVQDCQKCPELILIPPDSFEMGSKEWFDFEQPVHEVSIRKFFFMGRREVTFDEWDFCVAEGGCTYKPDFRGPQRGLLPVTDISWDDAEAFVRWLSKKTRKTYRLPSESEWEYAARAGTKTTYYWGQTAGINQANCLGCTSEKQTNTVEAGSYPPNAFGLLDMAGNAAEWVEDCWHDSYLGAPSDGSSWSKPHCLERVLRGGSFNNDPRYIRPAARFKYEHDVRYYANGFRVLREN